MLYEIAKLGRIRYVGDRNSKTVHDRWHSDCQGCGLDEVVRRGDAVGFTPDSLDAALLEDYEYCEACIDTTEPSPPKWASLAAPRATSEASELHMPALKRDRSKVGVTG